MALIIEPKADGIRITAHKSGNEIRLFTEDAKRDRSAYLPDVTSDIRNLSADNFIIDGEMLIFEDGKPIPRHEMTRLVTAKEPIKGEDIRYFGFDAIYHEEDLSSLPLKERLKHLDMSLPRDTKHLKRMPSYRVTNKNEYDEAIQKALSYPSSEGAMLKDENAPYSIGRGAGWAKYKAVKELKVQVIGILRKANPWSEFPKNDLVGKEAIQAYKELQSASQTYILRGAVLNKDGKSLVSISADHKLTEGDLELKWDAEQKKWKGLDDPRIWQMAKGIRRGAGDIAFANTYAKKLDPAPKLGNIATIRPMLMREFASDNRKFYSWEFPILQELDPERDKPDSLNDIKRIIQSQPETAGADSTNNLKTANPLRTLGESALADYSDAKWLNWETRVNPALYPQWFATLSSHHRGKSSHTDFRVKQNGSLKGWTITDLPEGALTEDINTVKQGRNSTDRINWKFGPNMLSNVGAISIRKAEQPLQWLNIREKVYPPGSVGACLDKSKVLTTIAWEDLRKLTSRRAIAVKGKSGIIYKLVHDVIINPVETKECFEIRVGPNKVIATYDHLWYASRLKEENIWTMSWELTKDLFHEISVKGEIVTESDGEWFESRHNHMAVPIAGLPKFALNDFKRWGWRISANGWYLLGQIKIRKAEIPNGTCNLSIKKFENYITPLGISHNTRFEEGVFNTRAVGFAYPGVIKPQFEEWFLDMKGPKETYDKRRLVFRQLQAPPPSEQKAPIKEPFFWKSFLAKDSPYLLSRRGRKKRDYIPPNDESGLPPWWEEKVSVGLRWWGKNLSRDKKFNLMDEARADLLKKLRGKKDAAQEGGLVTDPVKYLLKPNIIALATGKTRRFALKRHYWKGQCIGSRTKILTEEGFLPASKIKKGMALLSSDLTPVIADSVKSILFPRYLRIKYNVGSIVDPKTEKSSYKTGWAFSISENTPIWIRSQHHSYEGWMRADAIKIGDLLKLPVFICPDCGWRAPIRCLRAHFPCRNGSQPEEFEKRLLGTITDLGHTLHLYTPVKEIVWKTTMFPLVSIETKANWTGIRSFLTEIGPVHNTVIRDMPIEHWDLIVETGKSGLIDEYQFEQNPSLDPDQQYSSGYKELRTPPLKKKNVSEWFDWEGTIPPGKFGNPNKKINAFIETIDKGKVNVIADTELFKSFQFAGDRLKGYYILKREDPKSAFWIFSKSSLPGTNRTPVVTKQDTT